MPSPSDTFARCIWPPDVGPDAESGRSFNSRLRVGGDASEREAAVRRIMAAAGFDPSLRKAESRVRRVAGWLGKWYSRPLEILADQETNNKVQAMLEIRRAHPDWSPDRVAWWAQRAIGTPDPTDRPRVTEFPLFNVLVPFWTMNVHGNHDQLLRLAAEDPATQGARYASHLALKWAANFSGAALLENASDPRATVKGAARRAAFAAAFPDPLAAALEKVPERVRTDARERHHAP